MDEAARCDRVALMQGGRLLATDEPATIGRRFPRPLLAVRAPRRMALLDALRRYPQTASAYPFGESVHFSDRRGAAQAGAAVELGEWLAANGVEGAEVAPIEAGIEDVFMELMGDEETLPGAAA
jgi:ABC-type multidrug transport system ATPase subunit